MERSDRRVLGAKGKNWAIRLKRRRLSVFQMKESRRKFTAILEPADEGGYVVKCLELPGATEGETKSEAVRNIKEAVEGYLEVRAEVLGKSKVKKQMVEIAVKHSPGPLVA